MHIISVAQVVYTYCGFFGEQLNIICNNYINLANFTHTLSAVAREVTDRLFSLDTRKNKI